jgi:transposase
LSTVVALVYTQAMLKTGAEAASTAMSIVDLAVLVSALQVELVSVNSRLHEREIEIGALRETLVNLTHENQLLMRRLCGNKTERMRTSELQLALGSLLDEDTQLQKQLDEAVSNAAADQPVDGTPSGPSETTNPRETTKAKPQGRRDLLASGLPQVSLEVLDPELEKTAKRIGFERSLQLMHIRGGFKVLVKLTAKYELSGKDGPTVLGVETPKTLFPRGILHSSAVAHIVVQKFALGVPHHRLEQHLQDQGVELGRGMMCRYVEEAGNALGATIVHAMWRDAIDNGCIISTDATSALVQPSKSKGEPRQACKKAHFFTAVVDADHVLFAYAERHTQAFVQKLFHGFNGFLQCDAHSVYDILERGPCRQRMLLDSGEHDEDEKRISLVGCWAHCRRYFFEAAICRYPVGVQGLTRIRAIYAADNAFAGMPSAKRKLMRAEHVRPLMESFFEWVDQARTAAHGRDLATKALGYAFNQKLELLRVLNDARLPLDNTRSERSLRKIVVGRKNWMFYGSDTHAESAAAIFSIIASCRLHAIDPQQYLEEVLRVLPYWPPQRYLELAPNRWAATRAKLRHDELAAHLSAFTIPVA